MKQSAVDIGNPVYSKSVEPKFTIVTFTDQIQDDEGNDFTISVSYEYYMYPDMTKAVVRCNYDPMPVYYMTDNSMQESVIELILLREGAYYLECTPERYEPKYPVA